MSMYMPLVAKIVDNNPSVMASMVLWAPLRCEFGNYFILFVAYAGNNALIKFVEKWDVFVCDYVVAIKIC
jgi:hypothetical protein